MQKSIPQERPTLTDAQLQAELWKCEYCEEKPCREACPVHCSPADFIMAARGGTPSDFKRSAASILAANPLGGICGVVCPDYFCMKACVYRTFNAAVKIPPVQATIIRKANEFGIPPFPPAPRNGKRVAIVGGGPAGIGAAAILAQLGYALTIFETGATLGGMARLIPRYRLPKRDIENDIEFFRSLGDITIRTRQAAVDPRKLLKKGFDAVVISTGKASPITLGIKGEGRLTGWKKFLESRPASAVRNKRVLIIGGGAVAVDCAVSAARDGAASVEMVYRRRQADMPLTGEERKMILEYTIEVSSCLKPIEVVHKGMKVLGLRAQRMMLPQGKEALPKNFIPEKHAGEVFRECDIIVSAVGNRREAPAVNAAGLFYAGEVSTEAGTVVEAVASGKNIAGEVDAYLQGKRTRESRTPLKSKATLAGHASIPVQLEAEFFGRRIASPILLSAAPHTDGYAQMKEAYRRGWAGGVMKTAFDRVPVHIPSEYMFVLAPETYGNCDNVSGHQLDRVCREVRRLVKEFPDRLTLASTGGPVTGHDSADLRVWQSNTRKLEDAGAMGIEYSLSCPQGGDGTKGDMVSQDPEATAKVVEWVMAVSDAEVPKLFKLTGAVTSIRVVVQALKDVLAKYPGKKAGITLANSFPALAFRGGNGGTREKGIVIGMSGEGVLPLSNLTLAKVAGMGVTISANGGVMDYRAAANFLALGAGTVQCCTIAMKYGLGIVDELHSGLSYLLAERRLPSVAALIGSALPEPICRFEDLTATKRIPNVTRELCEHCGNCTRCPYLAISLDGELVPLFDPARCIGCSLCAQKCFAGAIAMRDRTPEELRLQAEEEKV